MTLEELKAEIEKLNENSKWFTMQISILDAIVTKIQEQPEQPKLERWEQIDFAQAPLTPREIARRKLEWLAWELNKDKEVSDYDYAYVVGNDRSVHHYAKVTGSIYFYTRADAEHALSQMTSEELEALR